jgi:hypothetical protein
MPSGCNRNGISNQQREKSVMAKPYIRNASKKRKEFTTKFVQKILKYHKTTGNFFWKKRTDTERINWWNSRFAGTKTGTFNRSTGYIIIYINRTRCPAHYLAWLLIKKTWPYHQIDHKNGKRTDNRFSNLREATTSQNSMNRKKYTNNTSGYKGVSWHKKAKKWCAQITGYAKDKHIGFFNTPEAAYRAYLQEAKKRFGKFSRNTKHF